jgi:hypothetical protein
LRLPVSLPSKLIAPSVESLIDRVLNLVPQRRSYSFAELEECVIKNPMVAAALDARIHLTLSAIDDYRNSDPAIEDEVRKSIEQISGSWNDKCAEILGYIPYGFSFTEKKYASFGSGAVLSGLQTLNQSRLYFEGSSGEISFVVYRGVDGIERRIPYTSGLHLKNQSHLLLDSSDPRGIASLERIRPLHEAYNIMLMALVLAAQRQATPILVQKTNLTSQVPLLDPTGRPALDSNNRPILINAGEQARRELTSLENGSIAVIDRLDDLMAIAQQSDGKLLLQGIDFLLGMMALSVLMPRSMLLTNAGGVGDSTLADAQYKILKQVIAQDIAKFSDSMVESVFRPMLDWNHGSLEDYGYFPIKEEGMINAAQMISAISSSVSTFATDPDIDPEFKTNAVDRIRQLAGIS